MTAARHHSTRHLVAPELLPGLELIPDLDFSQGMDAFRGGMPAREAPPLPPELAAVSCTERHLPVGEGRPEVRVLHYEPPAARATPRPAIVHIHGGGYVLGTPEINDASNRLLAATLGCVIVSVDYRLAPETTWEGSLADNAAALAWLSGNADALGVDPARIAIAGESAGGGHAALLAQHARAHGGPPICLQVLDAPMLDDRTGSTADPHPYTGEFVWTAQKNRFGWSALLGVAAGGPDVPAQAVPARARDLAGQPATYIAVGALDLFLEECLEYARRLTRAGVPVELHVTPGSYHGAGVMAAAPQNRQALEWKLSAYRRAFGI